MSSLSPYRLYQSCKQRWLTAVQRLDRDAIVAQVIADGKVSGEYIFMAAIAAGIAIIGLLLNSPAVIIGAMLISPLMGPIVLTGFSIPRVNAAMARQGVLGLLLGSAVALAVSLVVVRLSPIVDATPEILARTNPNLFDLTVAILSGAAGAFAMIWGRGGTIVGVAIATALMPPMTVVGYGLATSQLVLARGALFLFVTNMVAISMSAAFVATCYGFGRRGLGKDLARGALVALLALMPLSIPLASSLKEIAWETFVSRIARQTVEDLTTKNANARLIAFQVGFPTDERITVSGVVLTSHVHEELSQAVVKELQTRLQRQVTASIEQVLTGDVSRERAKASAIANPIQGASILPGSQLGVRGIISSTFPLATQAIDVNDTAKRITILPQLTDAVSLSALRHMERGLAAKLPDWQIAIIPPVQPLPRLYFMRNTATLTHPQLERLQDIVWAVKVWRIREVKVLGYASSDGEGPVKLARERATFVADQIRGAGINVVVEGQYPAFEQRKRERTLGYAAFRAVQVELAEPPSLLSEKVPELTER